MADDRDFLGITTGYFAFIAAVATAMEMNRL